MSETKIKGFKGFDENLCCRNFQYEVGTEYTHDGEISLCNKGFHFVENPLDAFSYYAPNTGRFAEVEADGVSSQKSNDSKRVAKALKVTAELSLSALCGIGVKFILDRVNWKDAKESNTGDQSAATNTGYQSAATNTGDRSAATNTGYRSAATNTGDQSAATNTGDQSAATNTGDQSAATNTGDQSAATNTGDQSAATNTGDQSAATNTGDRSAATNTGYRSAATNTGDQSAATNTGDQSAATNTGDRSAATNTGDQSAATNTGYQSAAVVEGKESCAISIGIEGTARGALGCWLTIAEWKYNDDKSEWHRVDVKTVKVDGKKIKANVAYRLKRGKFVAIQKASGE
jgi:hypothetical protein